MRLISSNPDALTVKNSTPEYLSVKRQHDGLFYEDFSSVSKVLMMEKNSPALPMFTESVIIPDTGGFNIEVSHDGFDEFYNVNILPSKGSLKRNVDPATIPYVFGEIYTENAFYPGVLAGVGDPFIFRDKRGATISFFPYQYNPVTKTLRVYKNISFSIIANPLLSAPNERLAASHEPVNAFTMMHKNLFLNAPAYEPLADEGEMLIVTPMQFLPAIQPLVDWKIEKGMKTTVATLEQTGYDPESIKSYITSFYFANPNLVYVQIVGDDEDVPTYSYGMTGSWEELYSDSFYGQIEGDDYFPELMVGRFSGNEQDIETMVARTIEYETQPLEGEWMLNAIGIGSDEGQGYGDDGEPDWLHLRNIGDKLVGFGYNTIHEFYDGSHGVNDASGSPSSAMISNALNAGAGLLNYCGHGAQDVMATGDYSSNDVNNLTNNGRYPFVISVACNNGTFAQGTSLCEEFTRATYSGNPTGAIASCGSSILMAWAEPMQTQDEIAELIVRSDDENIRTSLGGLFYNGQISMLEDYGQSYTAVEVMQTWVFFGDPSVLFRSQLTSDITANHEMEISQDGGPLLITSNTNDATVALTQDNEILATATTVDGMAAFDIPELASTSPIKVTITKQNTRAYRGQVEISLLASTEFERSFAIYPNPASSELNILSDSFASADIKLSDIHGRTVYQANAELNGGHQVPTGGLSSGVYILTINAVGQHLSKKIVVR